MDDTLEEQATAPEVSDHVTLPVGVEDASGVRHREVIIDEMSGIDDELVSGKKAGGNGAKGLTLVLCRCIQSIEGMVEQKKNPESLIERDIVRRMTQADRDYLVSRIFMLGGSDEATMQGSCPRCGISNEEEIHMSDLPVIQWPADKPLEIPFELPIGYRQTGRGPDVVHKTGVMRLINGVDQENLAQLGGAAIVTGLLAMCVKKLGTLENMDQEIAKRLKSRDRRYLMELLRTETPGLRQWKTVSCSGCSREMAIRVDMTSFFDSRKG